MLLPILCALSLCGGPNAAPVADDYTALLLSMDQLPAVDSGPLALSVEMIGGTAAPGRFGQALKANDGGLVVPAGADLDPGDALTIECWARVDGPSADIQRLVYRSGIYGLYLNSAGNRITFYVNSGTWTGLNATVPHNVWFHVAGVYDGQQMRLFIDGAEVAAKPHSGNITESRTPLGVGSDTSTKRCCLNGVIDEVRLTFAARKDFDTPLRYTPTSSVRPCAVPERPFPARPPKKTPAADQATTVTGEVRDTNGRRLAGVLVNSFGGPGRTDSWGRFSIPNLRRGKSVLAVQSARYEPLAVEVDLADANERVLLPPLRPIDPNSFAAAVPAAAAGFRLYAARPLDEIDVSVLPDAASEDAALKAFACPGEWEPLGATLIATRTLGKVELVVSDLVGPQGATMGAEDVRPWVIKRLFMRNHYSRPPEDSSLANRYLMPTKPFGMAAGTFRSLYVTVHVPDDAAPGRYRGNLTVTADGQRRTLPIEFEVLPIRLASPRKHYGIYYSDGARNPKTPEVVRRELADIRAHGADRIIAHPRMTYREEGEKVVLEVDPLTESISRLREAGFQPPYIVWDGLESLAAMTDGPTGPKFLASAKTAVETSRKLAAEKGWGELVLTHMDEVFNRDRFDRYVDLAKALRQVPEQRIYITFHTRPQPEVAEMTRLITPYVDIRCLHGHSVDEWIAAGHTWEELATEVSEPGKEAWCYYNLRGALEVPEWARLTNGYWLWLTPITTHTPWAYNSWRGDPLEDADGYDYGYAFPVGDRIVSTRLWEAYREGIDDLRYLSTLEAELEQAKQAGRDDAAVTTAQAWLKQLRDQLRSLPLEPQQSAIVKAMSAAYSSADYDLWRRQCARHIAALQHSK